MPHLLVGAFQPSLLRDIFPVFRHCSVCRGASMIERIHRLLALAIGAALLLFPGSAVAGQVVFANQSKATISCTVDRWTMATGFLFNWIATVRRHQAFDVGQNPARQGNPVINWV